MAFFIKNFGKIVDNDILNVEFRYSNTMSASCFRVSAPGFIYRVLRPST